MQLYSPSSTTSSSASSSSTSASNPTFLFSSSKSTKFYRSSRIIPTDTKYLRIHSPPSQLTLPPHSPIDHYFPIPLHDAPRSQTPNNYVIEPSEQTLPRRENFEQLPVVRRPSKDPEDEEVRNGDGEDEMDTGNDADDGNDDRKNVGDVSPIDYSLEKFAKKLPMFEPGRIDDEMSLSSSAKDKPLLVNLDLALYKAKIMTRNYQFEEAEKLLQECISIWPEDGRAYVALGKALRKQSKMGDARAVYEKGCQATQGENAYIWQCWADLENKMGNVRKARQLFDAATVADKRHIAAWHAWAVLELKQGNIKKARNLLAKGLKNCGGNEYVYQTLALLELRAGRYEQARYLFKQATQCNPKSCASWLAWAQLEMQQENNPSARDLFEKAVQASPKNRFAWHVWGLFEANIDNIDKARKLFKIGHLVNPYDPVLLQSLALLEYRHSTANLARVLFRRASELDPSHQPVWIAWGWMEWKEGNIATARELYQRALSISATTESASRCLHAWGVLEQRVGNLSAARRLFRSSLNINSQSYVTWMTWATLEEDQGNSVRAEEIRNLYFQQRTEVVDDAAWVMGFMDIIDPALDSLKRFLNLDQTYSSSPENSMEPLNLARSGNDEIIRQKSVALMTQFRRSSRFDLDGFIKEKLSLDASKLDAQMEASLTSIAKTKGSNKSSRLYKRGG